MKKTLFFLIIFIVFNNKSFSSTYKSSISTGPFCENKITQNYIGNIDEIKIKKIEIDTDNYRKWTVNSIRIITYPFRFTPEKYKKRFNATISVTYENGTKCIFKGRIRHHGDEKDHIALQENSIIQSLDIHLENGNIKGITKFKLYRPNARGVLEDEIIQTELLRNLNFLAPRTIKVNARINQAESVMLFQEKAAKELLEYNNRREGPILEGDQKFFFKLVENIPDNQLSNWSVQTPFLTSKSVRAMLTKQVNPIIINKSEIYETMSYNSLTNLNLIYLYFANRFQDEKNNFLYFDYDLDNSLLGFFNPKHVLKLDTYNLLMQATNSQHGLGPDGRKFYWNSIENYFEPINYDSNPYIDGTSPTTTTAIYRLPISEQFFEAFTELENKLNNLDLSKIHNNINISGIDLSNADIKAKINKIILNLSAIKKIYLNISEKELIEHNKFKPINNILTKFNEALNEIEPNVYLVKHNQNNGQLQRCKIYLEMCEDHYFSTEDISNLLEGKLILNEKIYQYLGKNLNFENITKHRSYNKLKFKKSTIFYDDGIEIKNNSNENILNIYQNAPGSRLYIIDGELENLTINFNGYKINQNDNELNLKVFPQNYPIDINGLTGCLSLINLKAKNISIKANGSSCEDTVNFINVEGSFNEINIKNSFSDGLDVDFSNLEIDLINISSSRNDCVDFSAGRYKLNKLNLTNCGDKALSVGEKSFLQLNEIIANNSNIGIASKDSSIVKLNNAYLKNLKTCVSAYNKKQEFSGGFIEIENMKCENYHKKTDTDIHSKIIEKNKIIKN